MRAFVAAGLLAAASGCAQILGADFDDAHPRVTGPCDINSSFSAPRRLPLNDTLTPAWGPRLSADQLTLYFTSADDNFVATRATLMDEFSNPVPLAAINSAAADMAPSLTADGLTYFLETTRAGDVKIFFAKRNAVGEEFSTPVLVEGVNTNDPGVIDFQPYVTPNGDALYFGSTRGPDGDHDLYRAEREAGSDRFQPPVALASINSSVDVWPVISPDELTLYFASARSLRGSPGNFDVLMATRGNKQQDFGAVRLVPGVNSPDADYPSWISPDACTLYMTRGPTPAMYVATRAR
jgi:Tol biopolymer transport system component